MDRKWDDWRRSPVGVAYKAGGFLLTVDLQHGRGLRLAHAVLRRAGVRALVLLPHAEQAQAVAVADLEPGGDNGDEIRWEIEERERERVIALIAVPRK